MSQRTITYRKCDGCHRDEWFDKVQIAESRQLPSIYTGESIQVDICEDCLNSDKYICHHCQSVHDDEHPCEKVRSMMDTDYSREQFECLT